MPVLATVIHETAEISAGARIAEGTRVWNHAQVREGASIGRESVLGKNVYIDCGVTIGAQVKIQNNVSIYHGVTIEDGVFIGPHVCFCNDLLPRAITPMGNIKEQADWLVGPILVRYGASIGAGAIILPNVVIGRFAMIGAGAVVTRSVSDHALMYGNSARQHGAVCRCGHRLTEVTHTPSELSGICSSCGQVCFPLMLDRPERTSCE